MAFVILFASIICIAQSNVHDNTSQATRTGNGAFTCTVVCDDDDDEEEDGIRVLPDDDYGSAMKSNTAYKGTAGFGIQFVKKKNGFIRNISGVNAIAGEGVIINEGIKWNFIAISEKEKRRITGRDADADGIAEDNNIKFLIFTENPETLMGFKKKNN
ncbi:MAG: hypothetical protein A2X61_12290 [Ignavibacteria bacterium GWB2_35_12]|nr:MAG: hypothetical protein A2X61_12290 [Ignavibacteria bacterium GWB2_35_12]OGU93441.1 MAG: hypothetical protein A2220_09325 [Ignavibacteria bacterium RIFOXYA2_FULL_35_10]OGV23307.1 MAG: hypothetical protein A2475_10155 [Ignavibacteria bacterium RIFOXYC2_FULL_35_21]